MVAEGRTSMSESLAYLALFLSLVRPDLQEQIKFNQASSNPVTNSLSPYNLTGLAFSTHYGTNNKIETLFSSNEALANGINDDPLSQYLNWQSDARFDANAVAMIFGDSTPRTQLGSLDSESGYSSDEAKSPLSTSSYHQSEPDLSDLGAAGYTPPSDLADLLNSFEDYVDIDYFQTTEPHKGILDVQENQFDFSGYEVKQEQNFYPNKLSPGENLLYSPEYKTSSPDASDFQDSFGMELENKFFDHFTIDFGNSFTNSSYEFGSGLDTELDLDSLGSLDFGLPLDILNPTEEADNNLLESQLDMLLQDPVTTRDNSGLPLNGPTTSVTTDIDVKPNISLLVPARNVDSLSTFQRHGQQGAKGVVTSTAENVTELKYESLRSDSLLFGVSEQTIIEMPVNEFNIFLEKLSEEEAKLVRETRRRGKNKEAARVCRKRKIDTIDTLDEELEMMKKEKKRILEERGAVLEETMSLKSKIKELENSVFSSLRDDHGRPLSSLEYSIFQGPNGAVYVGKTINDKGEKQDTR